MSASPSETKSGTTSEEVKAGGAEKKFIGAAAMEFPMLQMFGIAPAHYGFGAIMGGGFPAHLVKKEITHMPVPGCFNFTSLKSLLNGVHLLASAYHSGTKGEIIELSPFGAAAMLPVFLQAFKLLSPDRLPLAALDFVKGSEIYVQVVSLDSFVNDPSFSAAFSVLDPKFKKLPEDSLENIKNNFRLYFIFARIADFPKEKREPFENFLKDNEVFKRHPYRPHLIQFLFAGLVVGEGFGPEGLNPDQIGAVLDLFTSVPPRDYPMGTPEGQHFPGIAPCQFISALRDFFLGMRNKSKGPFIYFESVEQALMLERMEEVEKSKLLAQIRVLDRAIQEITEKREEAEKRAEKYKTFAEAHAESQRRELEKAESAAAAPERKSGKPKKSQQAAPGGAGAAASVSVSALSLVSESKDKEEKSKASAEPASGLTLKVKRLAEDLKAEQEKLRQLSEEHQRVLKLSEAQKGQLKTLEAKQKENNENKAKQAGELSTQKELIQGLKEELKNLRKTREAQDALIRDLKLEIGVRDFDLREQAGVIQALDEKLAARPSKYKRMCEAFRAALDEKKELIHEGYYLIHKLESACGKQSRQMKAAQATQASAQKQVDRLQEQVNQLIHENMGLHRRYSEQFNPYRNETPKSEIINIPLPGGAVLAASVPPVFEAVRDPKDCLDLSVTSETFIASAIHFSTAAAPFVPAYSEFSSGYYPQPVYYPGPPALVFSQQRGGRAYQQVPAGSPGGYPKSPH